MKKFILPLLLLTFFTASTQVKAATLPRSRVLSATAAAVRSATPSTSLKDRSINVATRSANIKSQNKFVIGKISSITSTTILVTTATGLGVAADTNSTTKFWDLITLKKEITIKGLKIGNRVAVLGVASGDATGIARIIARINEPAPRYSYWGRVTDIKKDILTIKDKESSSQAVLITKKTTIKVKGLVNPLIADLNVDQRVVVTGTKDTKGVLTATHLLVIPGLNSDKPKIASSSAQPASSSGKQASTSSNLNKISPTPRR